MVTTQNATLQDPCPYLQQNHTGAITKTIRLVNVSEEHEGTSRFKSETGQRKSRGVKRVKKLCGVDMGRVIVDGICAHEDGLLSWETIKNDLIKLMDSNIPGGEDGMLKEELIRLIALMDVRINGIDEILDVILGEWHIVRQLDSLIRSEIISSADL